jgi:hypothetical protein
MHARPASGRRVASLGRSDQARYTRNEATMP